LPPHEGQRRAHHVQHAGEARRNVLLDLRRGQRLSATPLDYGVVHLRYGVEKA